MALRGKLLAYFYALTLSLGVLCTPSAAQYLPAARQLDWFGSVEKIDASEHFDPGYIIIENNETHSFSYNNSVERDILSFYKTGNFYYSFVNNIYETAFTLSKIHEINFKFIDLIYPFNYFW